jgi:hypothetical protein
MGKPNCFLYVKSINQKNYEYDLTGYIPFLTNRAFAMHRDTLMLAETMNQHHELIPELQYEFYYNAVRAGKRFGFPPKPPEVNDLELIQNYFQYSRKKALEALEILTPKQIEEIRSKMDKGGRT